MCFKFLFCQGRSWMDSFHEGNHRYVTTWPFFVMFCYLVISLSWKAMWANNLNASTSALDKKMKYRKNCGTLNLHIVNLCKYLWLDFIELLLSCKPVSELNEHYFNFCTMAVLCCSASLPLEGVVTPLHAALAQNAPDVFSQTPEM